MRVSNELGSRHPKSAAFCVVVVTAIVFIISVFWAVVVLALRDVISYTFTEGPVVAAAVSDLCPLLALTLLLKGIQPVLSGTTSIFTHLPQFHTYNSCSVILVLRRRGGWVRVASLRGLCKRGLLLCGRSSVGCLPWFLFQTWCQGTYSFKFVKRITTLHNDMILLTFTLF